MTRKQCLMALMLTAFSAIAMAQTGSNGLSCRGLTGSAAAQCVQGVGPGRAASEAPLQDGSVGLTDSIRGFFNGQSEFSDRAGISTSLNCKGLIGAAVAQCLQGIGPGVPRTADETPAPTRTAKETFRQETKTPDGGQGARTVGDAAGDVVSSVRNFFSGFNLDPGSSNSGEDSGTSLNCKGLFGTAMARCLQGIAPPPAGNASPR